MQGSLNLSDQCRNRGFLKLGALGARIVQLCTDRGNREPPVRQWPKKILDALSAAGTAIKPASKILGFDYDRHPVMDARHVMVCARRQDGHRFDLAAVRTKPNLGEPSKGKKLIIIQTDKMWLLGPPASGPFIEAVSRHETAAMAHGAAKGRLVRCRLGPGVDQRRELAGVLDPRRDEAPAHQSQLARAFRIETSDENRLRRRDVVSRRKLVHGGTIEQPANCFGRGCEAIA